MTSLSLQDGENQCSIYFEQKNDSSYMATATHNHWVNYAPGQGYPAENFAEYTEGNAVEAFLGGKAYFAELLNIFKQAKNTIYITGWQVNWDAQLAEGIRLVDALLEAAIASPGLKIYVMPWDNPAQVQTWAEATERVFAVMNSHPEVKREAFHVQLAQSKSGQMFSHHQKCVIVDERVAFVGGIDLAYGRYDDHYGLVADADGRQGMNMYNTCIPPIASGQGYNPMEEKEYHGHDHSPTVEAEQKAVSAVLKKVLKHQLSQSPAASMQTVYLEPSIQPRMPWQDYQVRIEGPAVDDLIRNFVLRWNSYIHMSGMGALKTSNPELTLPAMSSRKKGRCQVQVLRSASLTMRQDEHQRMPGVAAKPHMKQDDILRGIHQLICKAEHYIYIENQFFVSAFGNVSGNAAEGELSPVAERIHPSMSAWATRLLPDEDSPQNQVAEWLGEKLKQIILSHMPQPFHVYMVLPVHPEGKLNDPTVVAQVYLTRQSLVFGSHSLLNRIRRSLWVRKQLEELAVPRREWYLWIPKLELACRDEYLQIPYTECDPYITLLNLRDHTIVGNMVVTEQIYVHSKLMIVDDRYVLVGSANINDRSLLGDRDSELAVLIADTEGGYTDLDGSGNKVPYRNFARELRQHAWRKWLGNAGYDCMDALEKPVMGWSQIQEIARSNSKYYEQVFNFIPRNFYNVENADSSDLTKNKDSKPATQQNRTSIWPTLPANASEIEGKERGMPFSDSFWEHYQFTDKQGGMKKIKGYFTTLPVHWTEGENNLIPYNTRLIADNNDEGESGGDIS